MKLNIQLFASLNVGDTYETTPVNIIPYGYSSAHYQMKMTVKLNSQNLSNFTSNITITSYMRTTGASWGWSGFSNNIYMERYTKVNDEAGYTRRNATDIPSLPTNNANNWVNCGSWTGDIQHRSNGTCSFYAKTYINTTNASSYKYIPRATEQESEILNVPALHKSPTIAIDSITEINSALTQYNVPNSTFVPYLSKKRFVFTPTLYDSATVTGVTISNGSTSVTGTASPLTLDFTNKTLYMTANVIPIKATISDNYNSTGETTVNYSNYIPYIKPTIIATTTTVKRNGQLSGKALLNFNATYYNGTVGSTNNVPTIKYRFWEKDTTEPSSWITINSGITINDNNISVSNYEIGSDNPSASNYFDFQKAYNVRIWFEDVFLNDSTLKTIPLGQPVWSEYKDKVDFAKITVKGTNPIEYDTNGTIFSTGTEYLYLSAVFQPPNVSATLYLQKRIPDGKTLSMSGNIRLFTGNAMPISTWTDISNLSPTITYIPNTNIVRIQLVTSITTGNWQDAVLNVSNGTTITMSTTT